MKFSDMFPGMRVYVGSYQKTYGTVGQIFGNEPCKIVKFDDGKIVKLSEENAEYFKQEPLH